MAYTTAMFRTCVAPTLMSVIVVEVYISQHDIQLGSTEVSFTRS